MRSRADEDDLKELRRLVEQAKTTVQQLESTYDIIGKEIEVARATLKRVQKALKDAER